LDDETLVVRAYYG